MLVLKQVRGFNPAEANEVKQVRGFNPAEANRVE
jgi:hypothetical protein